MSTKETLCRLGLGKPEVLLPASRIDYKKWAVIACDQFTQDAGYWDTVARFVGDEPSTFHIIFPEIYLETSGKQERIEKIHRTMRAYLEQGVFAPPRETFIYIERTTSQGSRKGLIACIDLEQYEWRMPENALIRATEDTVKERLPPRMDIRRFAPLESPHILLLINDKSDTLLPALGERAKASAPAGQSLYHTGLMLNSGTVTGWAVDRDEDVLFLARELESLARTDLPDAPCGGKKPFLFAVGDGNHSLAAAKAVWEEYKTLHAGENGLEGHPGRYAMVEIENLHDPDIRFEPIHRVLFGPQVVSGLLKTLSSLPGFASTQVGGEKELSALVAEPAVKNRAGLAVGNAFHLIEFSNSALAVALLQPLLDIFVKETGSTVDYVHGREAVFRAAKSSKETGAGILLPPVQKSGLFETVSRLGALPRKSFSMGEAAEKRFYFECRRIIG